MSAVDQAELQRIAQQVDLNRQRMESIQQQMKRLEQIRVEQMQTIETLSSISSKGAKGAMIPLGAGVQIVADIPPDAGAVIDIGSRVQAEKPRSEAIDILQKRTDEVLAIMNKMKVEFDSIEETTISLANIFNTQIATLQDEKTPETLQPKPHTQSPPPAKISRKKRKRGTELTLDD
jgi:prefoldin alpha subunit